MSGGKDLVSNIATDIIYFLFFNFYFTQQCKGVQKTMNIENITWNELLIYLGVFVLGVSLIAWSPFVYFIIPVMFWVNIAAIVLLAVGIVITFKKK